MPKTTTTRLHIIQTLISAKKPLIVSHIAQRMHASIQIVDYNARKMVCDGILLKNEEDNTYRPQPYFLDDAFYNSLFLMFYPYIEQIKERSDTSQANNGSFVFENLRSLLDLFQDNIAKLEKMAKTLQFAHKMKEN